MALAQTERTSQISGPDSRQLKKLGRPRGVAVHLPFAFRLVHLLVLAIQLLDVVFDCADRPDYSIHGSSRVSMITQCVDGINPISENDGAASAP